MDQQHLGKTGISIELAKRIDGEVVSADSMQIYKYMDIGSAKPTKEEMQGIPHYMLDIVEPSKRYSVADYKKEATKCMKDIIEKGKTPIVVGGTGLYINSLIYGINYADTKIDQEYRDLLEKEAEKKGLDSLYEKACKIDKEAMQNISRNDKKRIIRVLEIYKQTGKTKTELDKQSLQNEKEFDFKVFITNMQRDKLYEKINKRVDIMLEQGLIEEVKKLLEKYNEYPTAMQAIGYKETKLYLDGIITKEEMIEKIKMETRRYAKRQLTWFRQIKDAIWLDMEDPEETNIDKILEVI